jgi:mannose-1-phosphate guanylyltransferase
MENHETKTSENSRWGVVLAGGDGTRLKSLTRLMSGDERPKQFCRVIDDMTLLDRTIKRMSISIPKENMAISLTHAHEAYYDYLNKIIPLRQMVVQPANLGTAPAILYSLLRVESMDRNASVAFFPSDHYLSDDEVFMAQVMSAFDRVVIEPDKIVLLGVLPDYPESGYGWIEPVLHSTDKQAQLFSGVKKFWEKPDYRTASELMKKGCLWNSFVMVGHVCTFLNIIKRTLPGIYDYFLSVRPFIGTPDERKAFESVYEKITPINFSHTVLEESAGNLLVLEVKNVEWSDLGEPRRVLSLLKNGLFESDWSQYAVRISR